MSNSGGPRRWCVAAAVVATGASLTLAVPAQAVDVYTLEPLDFNIVTATPAVLQGHYCAAPYSCTKIDYPATLDPFYNGAILQGQQALDQTLRDDAGDKIVLAYSEGAQVVSEWLGGDYPNTEGAPDPKTTQFILISNPESKYGPPWGNKVTTDPAYPVTEVSIQYDGWSDWPTTNQPLAVANAVAGMMFVHPFDYFDVDINSPNNVSWSEGNITYVVVPRENLPLLEPLRYVGLDDLADQLNTQLKPVVDAAYDRPKAIPATTSSSSGTGSTATPSDPVDQFVTALRKPVAPLLNAIDAIAKQSAKSSTTTQVQALSATESTTPAKTVTKLWKKAVKTEAATEATAQNTQQQKSAKSGSLASAVKKATGDLRKAVKKTTADVKQRLTAATKAKTAQSQDN